MVLDAIDYAIEIFNTKSVTSLTAFDPEKGILYVLVVDSYGSGVLDGLLGKTATLSFDCTEEIDKSLDLSFDYSAVNFIYKRDAVGDRYLSINKEGD